MELYWQRVEIDFYSLVLVQITFQQLEVFFTVQIHFIKKLTCYFPYTLPLLLNRVSDSSSAPKYFTDAEILAVVSVGILL